MALYEAHVKLQLVSEDPFPLRRFLVTSEAPFAVGRASGSLKKTSSGPNASNAFFDSVVISRSHAEFSLSPLTAELKIRDVGSMHGTSVNFQKLKYLESKTLKQGDFVELGSSVYDNGTKHPTRQFSITFEILKEVPCLKSSDIIDLSSPVSSPANLPKKPNATKTNSYTVPDSSSESGDYDSDNKSVRITTKPVNGKYLKHVSDILTEVSSPPTEAFFAGNEQPSSSSSNSSASESHALLQQVTCPDIANYARSRQPSFSGHAEQHRREPQSKPKSPYRFPSLDAASDFDSKAGDVDDKGGDISKLDSECRSESEEENMEGANRFSSRRSSSSELSRPQVDIEEGVDIPTQMMKESETCCVRSPTSLHHSPKALKMATNFPKPQTPTAGSESGLKSSFQTSREVVSPLIILEGKHSVAASNSPLSHLTDRFEYPSLASKIPLPMSVEPRGDQDRKRQQPHSVSTGYYHVMDTAYEEKESSDPARYPYGRVTTLYKTPYSSDIVASGHTPRPDNYNGGHQQCVFPMDAGSKKDGEKAPERTMSRSKLSIQDLVEPKPTDVPRSSLVCQLGTTSTNKNRVKWEVEQKVPSSAALQTLTPAPDSARVSAPAVSQSRQENDVTEDYTPKSAGQAPSPGQMHHSSLFDHQARTMGMSQQSPELTPETSPLNSPTQIKLRSKLNGQSDRGALADFQMQLMLLEQQNNKRKALRNILATTPSECSLHTRGCSYPATGCQAQGIPTGWSFRRAGCNLDLCNALDNEEGEDEDEHEDEDGENDNDDDKRAHDHNHEQEQERDVLDGFDFEGYLNDDDMQTIDQCLAPTTTKTPDQSSPSTLGDLPEATSDIKVMFLDSSYVPPSIEDSPSPLIPAPESFHTPMDHSESCAIAAKVDAEEFPSITGTMATATTNSPLEPLSGYPGRSPIVASARAKSFMSPASSSLSTSRVRTAVNRRDQSLEKSVSLGAKVTPFMLGALVGGIGVFGALIGLPETYF